MCVFEPDALQKISSGAMTLRARTAIAEAFASWLIPLTMAFLSVTLGDSANRDLNMVLGGLFTLWGIIHVAICPIVHVSDKPSAHQLLICISTIVVTALIFWLAWNWQ
jgi:FtsH-binding integral membrane protein